jgi:porphobilinogen synthase
MPFASSSAYPSIRLRRLRRTPWLRDMLAESILLPQHLIWPLFVMEGEGQQPIASMPGVNRHSIASVVEQAIQAHAAGIPAIALFPKIDAGLKDEHGTEALKEGNLIARAIAAVKQAVPGIGIIADVALDPYTSHGHDGIVVGGDVENDATVEALCKQAVHLARAGADIVAPSDMMDGRIGRIRTALDDASFTHVAILSYAAKYASCFYGPFRDAVGSSAQLKGGKQTYQMNPANSREALREVALDIGEGADMVMIKPGMPYLDIVKTVADKSPVPVLAYQVSGEYTMLRLAADAGYMDWNKAMLESLLAFRRAGASAIFTYAALEMARLLSE